MRMGSSRVTPYLVAILVLGLTSAAPVSGDESGKPTAPATEARPSVPAAGHSLHGEAFDDGPRRSAYLMPGMGKVDFAATTANPVARAFVSQGVAQLHSFFYYEAERSFRQASKLDPDCATAYWGMAMANLNNSVRARGFSKEARKRGSRLSPRETLYLDAVDALHKDGVNDKVRKQDYLDALGLLVHNFPTDIDARAWLAQANWENGKLTSRVTVDLLIDSVLQVEPMHPGAHHYRIHLWDDVKPAWAEKSAALFGKSAPGIAHAWHMPGHTYTALHRYADAAYQQEASARVDHAYMIRDRVMPFEIHNYAHNNQWLVTSLSHVGRVRDALAVARNLVEQPRDPKKNTKNDGGSPQRSGRLRWSEVLTRYELWDDLIAATESEALDWSDVPDERKLKAYNLGLARAAKNDQTGLATQVDALKALLAEDTKAKRETGTPAALAELEGHQLLARREFAKAFERFGKATSMRPEALARAHLMAGDHSRAESAARDAVNKQPGQVPPLAAQVEILSADAKGEAAKEVYRKLATLSRTADPDTPVFRRLAPLIAAWRAETSWVEPAESASDELTAGRPVLASLGPLTWTPFLAEPIARVDTGGTPWGLAAHKGRNVVVLFYLGGKCALCMQQLRTFGKEAEALKALNTDLVAVSTDDLDASRQLKENTDGIPFPMPLLADPGLDLFKRYHAFDDFEDRPLHGIFLIDAAGALRYQRISSEPFLDVAFLKSEVGRVNRFSTPQPDPSNHAR